MKGENGSEEIRGEGNKWTEREGRIGEGREERKRRKRKGKEGEGARVPLIHISRYATGPDASSLALLLVNFSLSI